MVRWTLNAFCTDVNSLPFRVSSPERRDRDSNPEYPCGTPGFNSGSDLTSRPTLKRVARRSRCRGATYAGSKLNAEKRRLFSSSKTSMNHPAATVFAGNSRQLMRRPHELSGPEQFMTCCFGANRHRRTGVKTRFTQDDSSRDTNEALVSAAEVSGQQDRGIRKHGRKTSLFPHQFDSTGGNVCHVLRCMAMRIRGRPSPFAEVTGWKETAMCLIPQLAIIAKCAKLLQQSWCEMKRSRWSRACQRRT